jgi:RNA polymerase sigma-70 factor (ECF subfamily)
MRIEPASNEVIGWVGRFILPHEPRLRAWLRAAFASIDVDDVVQESYCRIAALSRVDHIDDPRQYLFRTARNVVLEQIRRSKVVSIETVSGFAELGEAMTEDAISPERVLAGRRSLERVEALISALPERARRVFRLRKIEGLSQREIATQMGISETIVENELTRGLRRILQSMTEEERAEMPVRRSRGKNHEQRTTNHDR